MDNKTRAPDIFRTGFLRPYEGQPTHSLYVEFAAVAAGLKPVLRTYAVLRRRYPALRRRLADFGLHSERSDFSVSSADGAGPDPAGDSVYVYVSRSAGLAARAKDCEERILGRARPSYRASLEFAGLMGYPRCCFLAFVDFVEGAGGGESHLCEYGALRRTRGAPSWLLNNLIRGDHYLISHYPCSYACGPSLAYAGALLGALRAARPALAARLPALLRAPVLKFSERGSYLRLPGGRAEGGLLRYRGCDGDARLVRLFSRGDAMRPRAAGIDIFRDGEPAGEYRRRDAADGTAFVFGEEP